MSTQGISDIVTVTAVTVIDQLYSFDQYHAREE